MLPQEWRAVRGRSFRLLARLGLVFFWAGSTATMAEAQAEIQVYTGDIAPPGIVNLTVHNNYIAEGATTSGGRLGSSLTGGTEFAYGGEPWLEYGVYLPIYTLADRRVVFDGAELRALFIAPHAAERDWVYGVNLALEFDRSQFSPQPVNLEVRPILGANFGAWNLTVNPSVETGFSGSGRIRFSPEERAAYAFAEHWSAAVEEYSDIGTFAGIEPTAKQLHTLFLVSDYKSGPWSVEAGVGKGLTQVSNDWTVKLILSCDLPRF